MAYLFSALALATVAAYTGRDPSFAARVDYWISFSVTNASPPSPLTTSSAGRLMRDSFENQTDSSPAKS